MVIRIGVTHGIAHIGVGFGELIDLIVSADESFHDADADKVLFQRSVERVHLLHHDLETGMSGFMGAQHAEQQDRRSDQEDDRHPYVDHRYHDEAHDQLDRRTYQHTDDHQECHTDLTDVRRQTGNERRDREMVDIGEGEVLDLVELLHTDVLDEARRRFCSDQTGDCAEDHCRHRHRDHDAAHLEYIAEISTVLPVDSLVDDHTHDTRDIHVEEDFDDNEDRSDDRVLFVLAQKSHQSFHTQKTRAFMPSLLLL